MSQDERELKFTIICSKAGGQKSLSAKNSLTGKELKWRLREALDLTPDTSLVLHFQNGSRNASKVLIEEDQRLQEQGVEDEATITVKIDAEEVRPENSALRDSIAQNGTSSYYYAHANENSLPPELRYVYGGDPIKLSADDAPATGYAGSKVSRPISKYSWADEGEFVWIYISAEGEPEAIEAAGDGKSNQVEVSFEQKSVDLRISGSTIDYALRLPQLEAEIVPEECKHRVSAGKRITLKMKKKRSGTWSRLVRPK